MYRLLERCLRVPGSAPAEAGVVLCAYLLALTLMPRGPVSPIAITLLTVLCWSFARRLPAAISEGPREAGRAALLGAGAMIVMVGALILWLDGTRWLMHLYGLVLLVPALRAAASLRNPARDSEMPPESVRQVARVHIITASLLILANATLAEAGVALHWVIFRAFAPVAFYLLMDLMADLTVPCEDE
ncbi:hypothetical protein DYI42_17915 [Vannielia litorea]|nr:hypothetical protein [Vannielia litorea]